MKKIITRLTITSLLFLSISCTSDDSTPTPPEPPKPTTTELLIGKWKIQEEGELVNGVKEVYEMDACSTKDTYEFTQNFKYINEYHETEVNKDCSAHIESAAWSLKDDTSLLLTYTSVEIPTLTETADVKIVRLTTTELQMEYKEEEGIIYYLHLKK